MPEHSHVTIGFKNIIFSSFKDIIQNGRGNLVLGFRMAGERGP